MSSVSHISNLIELEEGSWEPLICSQVGRKLWVTRGPTTWDWHLKGGWGQSCGTEPLTCGIWHYLQVDSVRIKFNCRTPSWCHRELLVVGKLPPLLHLVTRSVRSDVLCVIVSPNETWVCLTRAVKPIYWCPVVVKGSAAFIAGRQARSPGG